jgi:hypothetical protein
MRIKHKSKETKMLIVQLCESCGVDYVNMTAAMIRELPHVSRVRVVFETRQLEVLHCHPSSGLLQQVQEALLYAGRAGLLAEHPVNAAQ